MAAAAPRKRAPAKRAAKKAAAPPPSRRERLMARSRPSAAYRLLVDRAGAQAAQSEIEAVVAEARQVMGKTNPGSAEYRKAQKSVEQAEARLEQFYETITLTALPPDEYEALIEAHPPQQKAEQNGEHGDREYWNEATFQPALLAACTDVEGMTEADWAEFLHGSMSGAERNELWALAVALNDNSRFAESVVLPKGLTLMRGLRSNSM